MRQEAGIRRPRRLQHRLRLGRLSLHLRLGRLGLRLHLDRLGLRLPDLRRVLPRRLAL